MADRTTIIVRVAIAEKVGRLRSNDGADRREGETRVGSETLVLQDYPGTGGAQQDLPRSNSGLPERRIDYWMFHWLLDSQAPDWNGSSGDCQRQLQDCHGSAERRPIYHGTIRCLRL